MAKEKTLISIDAGMSTGLVVGTYSDGSPFELTHAFQIEGGVEGFLERVSHYEDTDSFSDGGNCFSVEDLTDCWRKTFVLWYGDILGRDYVEEPTILVEKFNARGSANSGFSYTTASLEPLRVEGAILAMGVNPHWVQPAQQYFLGGKDKTEKKKRQHKWLKDNGFYISPKSVGAKDADDARSALSHCISYLRRQKHKPTLDLFREESND